MKAFQAIFALSVLLIHGCINETQEFSNAEIFHIDIDNITETVDLKLSDLADSFKLIKLETTSECLLDGNTSFYIGDQYIIATSKDGIYKFSPDGTYISKLINQGRGPQELTMVAGFIASFIDEKTNYLYIDDQMRRKEFLVYDIQSERFLNPVKKWLPGFASFAIYNDSLIIRSVSGYNDSVNYAVYLQNLKGELISGINNYKKIINNKNNDELFQQSLLSIGNNNFYIYFSHDDTLFQIKNNQLAPYLVLNFNKPRENPPHSPREKGDRSISYSRVEAPSFIIIGVSILDERVQVSPDAVDIKTNNNFFFFNKSTGSGSKIRSYTDDLINKTQVDLNLQRVFNGGSSSIIQFLPNGKLVISYNQYEIKEAVERGLNFTDFPESLNEQLLKISENMDEMDNPVLLVGILKGM